MQKPKTKAQVRAEIEQQVASYLSEGGHVSQHPRGESGRLGALHPFKTSHSERPTEGRTPVNDAIAAIESRKRPSEKPTRAQQKKPKKILLKDDFGQPLRWVWQDET